MSLPAPKFVLSPERAQVPSEGSRRTGPVRAGQGTGLTGPQEEQSCRDVILSLGPQDIEGEKKDESFTLPSLGALQGSCGITMLLPLLSC